MDQSLGRGKGTIGPTMSEFKLGIQFRISLCSSFATKPIEDKANLPMEEDLT
ncbi:hypothetical protein SLEP1_g45605 [Rubroshorea leprosula]|uniref:Uncharacterized protein n=1 Tax=Rubroshorea leprosula TaxID=152421 RepID=A0AAV5LKD2_9ROSI|nr:hypothetical protein SLEP1_g45605 [Rubroshorea leprosula]